MHSLLTEITKAFFQVFILGMTEKQILNHSNQHIQKELKYKRYNN